MRKDEGILKEFWAESARLIDEYRKEGREDRVQGIVDCRILISRIKNVQTESIGQCKHEWELLTDNDYSSFKCRKCQIED